MSDEPRYTKEEVDFFMAQLKEGLPLWKIYSQIGERCEGVKNGALTPGDTDFQKGQVAALRWVIEQFNDRLKTRPDTN